MNYNGIIVSFVLSLVPVANFVIIAGLTHGIMATFGEEDEDQET